ncbi:OmpA family protein [Portibacter lacus]|uniref:OmpA-like domain-containing protein n=1 Tax=Portibacter lacus TaxID=1099794 RepID=A0AA37SRY1_9BACT|nr:OmpA family protein [Portibacter lacus]GLR17013.1 hypothetical protein GCM10007940_16280 [Portibacter lacus]
MKILTGISFIFCLLVGFSAQAQEEVIYLKNPSFEGLPRAGGAAYSGISAAGWIDCGPFMFPSETPPDIHPGNFFRVQKPAQDGKTYIGLVARENETWESVSQLLSAPLKEGQCYSINLFLSRSDNYVNKQTNDSSDEVKSQGNPLVLRIYGGLRPCEKKQILAESQLISHTDWRNYEFEFEASDNIYYLTLEAFYKTPVLLPYNGNLLIDNISEIKRIPCPNEEPFEVAETPVKPKPKVVTPKPNPKDVVEPEVAKNDVPEEIVPRPKKQKIITQELNSETIAKGQTIQINKLYFAADSSSINKDSYSALNEVYDFLEENPNIRIEIGGHTNGIPPSAYCDKLSTERAKEIAEYIIRKGIRPSRLEYKGYGKRKPIASNDTKEGRKRNQRVEITILNVN